MPVDPRLLVLLVCPDCHGSVRELAGEAGIECTACGRVYPVREGIAVMLIEEATPGRGGPRPS
jgi:uncharacterized protein YbaR (Trm112 family)